MATRSVSSFRLPSRDAFALRQEEVRARIQRQRELGGRLRTAIVIGAPEAEIQRLLRAGASPDSIDDGDPLLVVAARKSYPGEPSAQAYMEISNLLYKRARVDEKDGSSRREVKLDGMAPWFEKTGRTALHIAAAACDLALVELLLRHDANPDYIPQNGIKDWTATRAANITEKSLPPGPAQESCKQVQVRLIQGSKDYAYNHSMEGVRARWAREDAASSNHRAFLEYNERYRERRDWRLSISDRVKPRTVSSPGASAGSRAQPGNRVGGGR